jgi:hypothetical protein
VLGRERTSARRLHLGLPRRDLRRQRAEDRGIAVFFPNTSVNRSCDYNVQTIGARAVHRSTESRMYLRNTSKAAGPLSSRKNGINTARSRMLPLAATSMANRDGPVCQNMQLHRSGTLTGLRRRKSSFDKPLSFHYRSVGRSDYDMLDKCGGDGRRARASSERSASGAHVCRLGPNIDVAR